MKNGAMILEKKIALFKRAAIFEGLSVDAQQNLAQLAVLKQFHHVTLKQRD